MGSILFLPSRLLLTVGWLLLMSEPPFGTTCWAFQEPAGMGPQCVMPGLVPCHWLAGKTSSALWFLPPCYCRARRLEGMCCSVWACLQALADASECCPAVPIPPVGTRVPKAPAPAVLIEPLATIMSFVGTFCPDLPSLMGESAFVRPVQSMFEAAAEVGGTSP